MAEVTTIETVLRSEEALTLRGISAVGEGPKADALNAYLEKTRQALGCIDGAGNGSEDMAGVRYILSRVLHRQEARVAVSDLDADQVEGLKKSNLAIRALIEDLDAEKQKQDESPEPATETSESLPDVSDADYADLMGSLGEDDGGAHATTSDGAKKIAEEKNPDSEAIVGPDDEDDRATKGDEADGAPQSQENDQMTTEDTLEKEETATDAPVKDDTVREDVSSDVDADTGDTDADEGRDTDTDTDAPAAQSDEGILEQMVEDMFPAFNKIARNRFGTGKALMIAASRNVQRNQRNILVEVTPDSIKWAAGADLETQLMVFAKDAKGRHRVITVDITEHLDELKEGRVRLSLNLWDDYGNAENVSATIGTTKNPIELETVKVEDWSQE